MAQILMKLNTASPSLCAFSSQLHILNPLVSFGNRMAGSNTDLPPGTYRHLVLVLQGECHEHWNYLGQNEPWLAVKVIEDYILDSRLELEVVWHTALMDLLAQVCQDGPYT
jgi:hypothetical protein